MRSAGDVYFLLDCDQLVPEITNQPKWLTKGGDLREAQVDYPWPVWPFLRLAALLASLTHT